MKEYYGKTLITRINLDSVERFIEDCQERKVSVPTIKKILTTFQAIMSYACKKRYININPVKEAERPENQNEYDHDKERVEILQPTQLKNLLESVGWYGKKNKETGKQEWHKIEDRDVLKYKTLHMTAILTGMRQGEILGLKWNDINWDTCQIEVKRTYNHDRFYEPKTKTSRRNIDMAPHLVAQLKEWQIACPPNEFNLVFPNGEGNPINASNLINRVFKQALKKAKLPDVRFHSLRHSFASLLIEQDENPKYIQNQMGHSSIKVTYDIYGHLMKTENQEAASRLGDAVFGPDSSKMVAKNKKGFQSNG